MTSQTSVDHQDYFSIPFVCVLPVRARTHFLVLSSCARQACSYPQSPEEGIESLVGSCLTRVLGLCKRSKYC